MMPLIHIAQLKRAIVVLGALTESLEDVRAKRELRGIIDSLIEITEKPKKENKNGRSYQYRRPRIITKKSQ